LPNPMKTKSFPRQAEQAFLGIALALVILIVGSIMVIKLYSTAQKLLNKPAPPPQPEEPQQTNSPPFTNGWGYAAWTSLPVTNPPGLVPAGQTVNVLYGMMDSSRAIVLRAKPGTDDGMVDWAGLLDALGHDWLIGPSRYTNINTVSWEWVWNGSAWTQQVVAQPPPVSYDNSSGIITLASLTNQQPARAAVLQWSPDAIQYSDVVSNQLGAGQFFFYQDQRTNGAGYYRVRLPQ